MFKALSSETRRKMLKILTREEMHITGLARKIGISVPVAAKHVNILEKAGLLERKKFGRTHVLKVNLDRIKVDSVYEDLDIFSEVHDLKVSQGTNVLDALKQVSGVEVARVGDKEFITSVDGESGYYIYEVDGKSPQLPMDEYLIDGRVKVELKKLVPVKRKEMDIKTKD
jgi:DNA-binding transcriptional ArsR family regulator